MIRFLDWLAQAWQKRGEPGNGLAELVRWLQRLTWFATLAYGALLALLLGAMEWWGESHWLLAFCLFLPPQGWLLPLLGLAPVALILHRRSLLVQAACFLLVTVVYMDPEFHRPRTARGRVITVMTNNIGQSNKQGFTEFLQQEKPDVIAMQESNSRAQQYQRAYPEYQAAAVGQFSLLTKYPVKASGYVPIPGRVYGPVAAWFELDFHGQSVILYNVHLTTPRQELFSLRGRGLLLALAGIILPRGRAAEFHQFQMDTWRQRQEVAAKLVAHLGTETRPFILAGDFNMPNHGTIYHQFSRPYEDAFETTGWGYGLTFPGYSSNPLTLFGPWLRLDYIFAGRGFRPLACRAEPSRRSQHRSVAARLELTENP